MKLLDTFPLDNGKLIKLYHKFETNEYVLRFYNHLGVWMDASDYFASDKEDAIDMAEFYAERTIPLVNKSEGIPHAR